MKLTIERSKWLRGEKAEVSRLLRKSDSKMCCLGFMCLSIGLTSEQIEGQQTPHGVSCNTLDGGRKLLEHKWMTASVPASEESSQPVWQMMKVNDNINLTDEQREEKLTTLFKQVGVEVEFV